MNGNVAAQQLMSHLGLRTPPVAVAFPSTAPAGIPRVADVGPSGCSYWKRAAEGHTFYTEEADHYNCPIGAYTHGIDLPAERAQELEGVVTTMIQLGYLRSEEVAGIPRRPGGFRVAVYAPLAETPVEPEVVLVRGNARQMMLLSEAANAAGLGCAAGLMGRPTCAAIPEVLRTGQLAGSLACIGNRVYNDLPDDEFYLALPGKAVEKVAEKLSVIVHANQELKNYHLARV